MGRLGVVISQLAGWAPGCAPDVAGPTPAHAGMAAAGAGEEGERRGKQSRSEKKSRKAVQKLGMKPVPGVMRVQIKKSKNVGGSGEGSLDRGKQRGCERGATCHPPFDMCSLRPAPCAADSVRHQQARRVQEPLL